MGILSEFLSVVKRTLPDGLAVELRDAFGKCVVRTQAHRPGEVAPELTLGIGLPGYSLSVWRVMPRSHALRYLTVLLPPFLALVLGGVLLVLEITRERRESMQKTGFVSNVSHELKTPLTAVRLSAEMLRGGRVKELGADDYVTKPFGVRELLARIAAALRRSAPQNASGSTTEDFDFAGVAVSVKCYCLKRPKGTEPVTDIELKLTREFAAHRDEVLSRDALLNAVWGHDYFGTTRTFDQHVANLRRKLEKVGGKPQAIGTVHGVGYRYL